MCGHRPHPKRPCAEDRGRPGVGGASGQPRSDLPELFCITQIVRVNAGPGGAPAAFLRAIGLVSAPGLAHGRGTQRVCARRGIPRGFLSPAAASPAPCCFPGAPLRAPCAPTVTAPVFVDVCYPPAGVPKLRELAVCRRACCDDAPGPSRASRFARIYVIYSRFGTLALRRETALPRR
jgi:hypothetical protein